MVRFNEIKNSAQLIIFFCFTQFLPLLTQNLRQCYGTGIWQKSWPDAIPFVIDGAAIEICIVMFVKPPKTLADAETFCQETPEGKLLTNETYSKLKDEFTKHNFSNAIYAKKTFKLFVDIGSTQQKCTTIEIKANGKFSGKTPMDTTCQIPMPFVCEFKFSYDCSWYFRFPTNGEQNATVIFVRNSDFQHQKRCDNMLMSGDRIFPTMDECQKFAKQWSQWSPCSATCVDPSVQTPTQSRYMCNPKTFENRTCNVERLCGNKSSASSSSHIANVSSSLQFTQSAFSNATSGLQTIAPSSSGLSLTTIILCIILVILFIAVIAICTTRKRKRRKKKIKEKTTDTSGKDSSKGDELRRRKNVESHAAVVDKSDSEKFEKRKSKKKFQEHSEIAKSKKKNVTFDKIQSEKIERGKSMIKLAEKSEKSEKIASKKSVRETTTSKTEEAAKKIKIKSNQKTVSSLKGSKVVKKVTGAKGHSSDLSLPALSLDAKLYSFPKPRNKSIAGKSTLMKKSKFVRSKIAKK